MAPFSSLPSEDPHRFDGFSICEASKVDLDLNSPHAPEAAKSRRQAQFLHHHATAANVCRVPRGLYGPILYSPRAISSREVDVDIGVGCIIQLGRPILVPGLCRESSCGGRGSAAQRLSSIRPVQRARQLRPVAEASLPHSGGIGIIAGHSSAWSTADSPPQMIAVGVHDRVRRRATDLEVLARFECE